MVDIGDQPDHGAETTQTPETSSLLPEGGTTIPESNPATDEAGTTQPSPAAETSSEPTGPQVPYTIVELPSGQLFVKHELTLGDGLIAFGLMAACLLAIGKWAWEAIK